jgi:adenylylsulfate kinase-like enzyme
MGNCRNRMTWNSNNEGRVIWITGLSGAGKSTIARAAVEQLRDQAESPVLLDGDAVREAIRDPHIEHDPDSRLANAYRICRLAKLLADQGHTVIVATMSIYHEIHSWNRRNCPNYFEVWVEVDLDALQKQDARNLYSRAQSGKAKNVAGLDLDYERPLHPDLILTNNPPFCDPEELAEELVHSVQHKPTTQVLP